MFAATKIHPNLIASAKGPCTLSPNGTDQPVHLQQSDLDAACGPHCLFMALAILKVFDRRSICSLTRQTRNTRVNRVLKGSRDCFFSGTDTADLQAILAPVSETVQYEVSHDAHSRLGDFVLRQLDRQWLVIFGIQNWRIRLYHWVLAVGMAGLEMEGRFVPDEFLLLDPGCPPLPMVAWNSHVTLRPKAYRSRYRLMRDAAGKEIPVALDSAVALGLKTVP